MPHFINLSQATGETTFAFYDYEGNIIISLNNEQVFESVSHLTEAYEAEQASRKSIGEHYRMYRIEALIGLIPAGFFGY